MSEIDRMARELLARHVEKTTGGLAARLIRDGRVDGGIRTQCALDVIRDALLDSPPGYVLVPVEAAEGEIDAVAYAIPASIPTLDVAKWVALKVRNYMVAKAQELKQ